MIHIEKKVDPHPWKTSQVRKVMFDFISLFNLKTLEQCLCHVSSIRVYALKCNRSLILMFFQCSFQCFNIFSLHEHALAILLEKWKNSFPRLYSRACFCSYYGILRWSFAVLPKFFVQSLWNFLNMIFNNT